MRHDKLLRLINDIKSYNITSDIMPVSRSGLCYSLISNHLSSGLSPLPYNKLQIYLPQITSLKGLITWKGQPMFQGQITNNCRTNSTVENRGELEYKIAQGLSYIDPKQEPWYDEDPNAVFQEQQRLHQLYSLSSFQFIIKWL